MSNYDTGNVLQPPDTSDAEIARLRAELAERDAELARLRELHGKACEIAAEYRQRAEQPRTDAEWKAADRKKRINDLAADYAGRLLSGPRIDSLISTIYAPDVVSVARYVAAAVVEAEE